MTGSAVSRSSDLADLTAGEPDGRFTEVPRASRPRGASVHDTRAGKRWPARVVGTPHKSSAAPS